MDFSFTEEQNMLVDTAERFVSKEYGFETRNRIIASETGMSETVWQGLADLGLLALLVPEEDGGLNAGPVETMLVMSALGKGLLVEPYLASAVMSTRAIATLASPDQRGEWLERMLGGELIVAFAHDELGTRHDRLAIETRATRIGAGYLLDGRKSVIRHAPQAGMLLVSALVEDGVALFALDRDTPGVRLAGYPSVDGARAADVFLEQVYLPESRRLGQGDASDALLAVLDTGLAALCGEALGVLQRSLDTTIEYARTRKQFGVPIGKFQALQHRMADMLIHVEQARSMTYLAAVRALDGDAARRATALSAAKVVVGEACRFVGQQAVQIHGGMGVTDELDISHCFKRLFAIEKTFGSTLDHLDHYRRTLAA